jgi:hypothetical protein
MALTFRDYSADQERPESNSHRSAFIGVYRRLIKQILFESFAKRQPISIGRR